MPPKGHRNTGSGQLRAHSRNSSAAKLGANLQLTQKEPQARKGYAHLAHEGHARPGIARTNSAIRTASKDQVAPPRRNASEIKLPPQRTTGAGNKPKVGFTINADDDDDQDDDDDDDDAWISTESGAVTPSGHESESEESDAGTQARTPISQTASTSPTQTQTHTPTSRRLPNPHPRSRNPMSL
ncbi:hypothetical protein ONZ45_g7186 [Pleurotus djamor]|nr:hypothetical protein ONZ45_g7186 [Pleurotus djamor]